MNKFETLADLDSLKHMLKIDETTVAAVQRYGQIMDSKMPELIEQFYLWMSDTEFFSRFFAEERKIARVKQALESYWRELFICNLDQNYFDSRRSLGELHAHIGLPVTAYFAAMDVSLSLILNDCYDGSLSDSDYHQCQMAVMKICHLDTTIVIETYNQIVARRISNQTASLVAMSTPVTVLWDEILLLPIVGIIDSSRAHEIMESSLSTISRTSAKVFIFDISGVSVVDTEVANHLMKIIRAAELMGCMCITSGLSASIAQTIVELGIDTSRMTTTANLRNAVELAFVKVGVHIEKA